MNDVHPTIDRLEAAASGALDAAERRHLTDCPGCPLEARLLQEMGSDHIPDALPGLDIASQSLSLMRGSVIQGSSTHTHVVGGEEDARAVAEVLAQVPERAYETLGPIGVGGMGVVWRVQDQRLQRQVAMKWLRPSRMKSPAVVARFVQEAPVTARLQHPGIVPVHAFGQLPDGRPNFTMKEVQGRTLEEVVAEVHDASSWGPWMAGPSGWTLRRVVDAFHRVCEAVAYAHSEGVVHRDLKPANIMVAAYGEVQMLDRGLARVLDRGDDACPLDAEGGDSGDAQETKAGSIVGTLPYMPPEQARGDLALVGPTADVYALSVTLYHILTGRPPYMGTPDEVIADLAAGPPAAIDTLAQERALPPVPGELIAICERAMARSPGGRHANASALADGIADWLDGARRREQALKVVDEADALRPELARLRARAAELRRKQGIARKGLAPDAPLSAKRPIWALEDQLTEIEDRIAVAEVEQLKLLRGALTLERPLPKAHERLADHHRSEHARAEARRDNSLTRRHEMLLRAHGEARFEAYLKGDGALTLVTDPPGVEALLHTLVRRDRRLVPEGARSLGVTPIEAAPIEMGSYLVKLRAEGRPPVAYPVNIRRQERWHGRPPEGGGAEAMPIPALGALGDDGVYVPPGWCLTVGDDGAREAWPDRWVWAGGFVMERFPVTNARYLAFLNDLNARGLGEEAARRAPRERSRPGGERGAIIYARAADGSFALGADADADRWDPQWPVIMIDWHDACAFAAWQAERTGQPWRLPHELEWEKAARGVDGRVFPWGDDFEPLYACMRGSPPGRRSPAMVDSFPADQSPFGIRGMAGNVGDWCLNGYDEPPPEDGARLVVPPPTPTPGPKAKRGGAWQHDATVMRVTERHGLDPSYHSAILEFQLVRGVG